MSTYPDNSESILMDHEYYANNASEILASRIDRFELDVLEQNIIREAIKYRRRWRATDGKEFTPTDEARPLVEAIDAYLKEEKP